LPGTELRREGDRIVKTTDCWYCGLDRDKGVHNGRGGHLYIARVITLHDALVFRIVAAAKVKAAA
jgi:hypothetical protein